MTLKNNSKQKTHLAYALIFLLVICISLIKQQRGLLFDNSFSSYSQIGTLDNMFIFKEGVLNHECLCKKIDQIVFLKFPSNYK